MFDGSSDPAGGWWMDAKDARRLCVVRFHARLGRRSGVSVGPAGVMVWLFFVGPLYVIFGLVWVLGWAIYLALRWVVGPLCVLAVKAIVAAVEARRRSVAARNRRPVQDK